MYKLRKPKNDESDGRYVIIWGEKGWIFYAENVDDAIYQVRNNKFAWGVNHSTISKTWEDVGIVFNTTEELKMYLLLDG